MRIIPSHVERATEAWHNLLQARENARTSADAAVVARQSLIEIVERSREALSRPIYPF